MAFKFSSELVDAAGVAMPYVKRKRLIEWQRQIELLHIFVNPHERDLYRYIGPWIHTSRSERNRKGIGIDRYISRKKRKGKTKEKSWIN